MNLLCGNSRPERRTRPAPKQGYRGRLRAGQTGIALVLALLLLVVLSMIGIAGIRGTIMQQKMASNQYDRELAFQSAEAALRAATALVVNTPSIVARNCQTGASDCPINPFNDPNLPVGSIRLINQGSAVGQFTASELAASQPQYVVESMGNWVNPDSNTGFNQSANAHNYGAQGLSSTAVYYRITARSGDPAVVKDRAVVTLQVVIKQG